MATRKRTYRRRYRPRTYRRRIRRYYKRHIPRSRTSRMFVKLRLTRSIVTDAIPGRLAYISVQALASKPFVDVASQFAEWPSVQELYAMYRVSAIKIKVFPTANTQEVAALHSAGSYFLPVYVAYFPSYTSSSESSQGQLLENQYCKVFNAYRPFKYYTKVWRKTNMGGDIRGYIPTTNSFTSSASRIEMLFDGQRGDPSLQDISLFTLVLTFYIALKHRD
ncbi:capsid protein [Gopherus associated circular DNA virus 9]|nr:capsid protein [Gopherus associated circular DNA virus 9]